MIIAVERISLLLFLKYIFNFLQDVRVSYDQIEPVIVLIGRPRFGPSPEHGRVFIPQTMVEPVEQMNGSDTTEKGTDGTKDTHQEAGVDNEYRRQAVVKLDKDKATWARDLGPEIARETDIDEQKKALEEFKKAKQRENNKAPDKGVQEGKGVAVLNFEKEKAALVQHLGPEIARETNIEEQVKGLGRFQKLKQRKDNADPDKGMQPVGSSADSQYQAVQHCYPQSNSQLGRQSSYTQDPHQGSRQPSVVVPAQGDWDAQQYVGSAVVVSNINPPMCGTIRWIGTIPQVNGYVAGVELVSVT